MPSKNGIIHQQQDIVTKEPFTFILKLFFKHNVPMGIERNRRNELRRAFWLNLNTKHIPRLVETEITQVVIDTASALGAMMIP
jgi:hypothetical protein